MDLSTKTPVEIDTMLAALDGAAWDLRSKAMRAAETVYRIAGARPNHYTRGWSMTEAEATEKVQAIVDDETALRWDRQAAEKALAAVKALDEAIAANRAEQAPLHAEYNRRPWTRAFLVQGNNGHVHSSMYCSTCNKGNEPTQFVWMIDYSGASEEQIVEDAGERACTVCYPTAPVSVLSRPTKMFGPDEIAAAKAREEREQAKAKRQADKIAKGLTADGSELVVEWTEVRGGWDLVEGTRERAHVVRERISRESFKTERAAIQWVVQQRAWSRGQVEGTQAEAFEVIYEAVATKHGKTVDEVRAEIDTKVAAKIKKDGL